MDVQLQRVHCTDASSTPLLKLDEEYLTLSSLISKKEEELKHLRIRCNSVHLERETIRAAQRKARLHLKFIDIFRKYDLVILQQLCDDYLQLAEYIAAEPLANDFIGNRFGIDWELAEKMVRPDQT